MPFLTIAGENKLAQNQSVSGGLAIVSFVLANVPDLGTEPDDRIENMPNASLIVDTLNYTKRGYVNPNQVVYSLVMGSDVGDYDFNWIGLVDEDGVLIAVSYTPTIQKRKNDGGIPGNTFTRNFLLKYIGIQSITATTVPVETWQIDFGTRLIGIDERERLSNFDIYSQAGFLEDGWKVTGSASPYTIKAGIGYVGGIQAKNASAQPIVVSTKPNSIWLDTSLQGDISDMSTVVDIIVKTEDQTNYTDSNGIAHYVTKIAEIDEVGVITDLRSIYENVAQHEAKDDPHPQYHDAGKLNAGTVPLVRLPPEVLTTEKANFVGSIHFFTTKNTPIGFLKPNNGEISRTSYANLYLFAVNSGNMAASEEEKLLGQYGPGDGENTFTLPSADGYFFRVWDETGAIDPARVFGSSQNDEIARHNHTRPYGGSAQAGDDNGGAPIGTGTGYGTGRREGPTGSTGGVETRPKNIAYAAYIKY